MDDVTKDNFISLLLDKENCDSILKRYESEQGGKLPFRNHIKNLSTEVRLDFETATLLKNKLLTKGKIGENIFEELIFNPTFPEKLLYQLLEENKFILSLAHRKGPIDFLLKIARIEGSPSEALLTIGHHYYDSEKISVQQFKSFLDEFSSREELFISLAYYIKEKNEKQEIFSLFIKDNIEIRNILEVSIITKELLHTSDQDFISEKFKQGFPKYFVSIAKNIHTPIELLEKLMEVKQIKYASIIRSAAAQTLRKKMK